MKLIQKAILLLAALSIPLAAFGQSKVGTTAAPFLTIGIGSRPIGMGGAFVSMCDDAHSLYWNAAGLARLKQSEAILVHTDYLAGMSFDFVGAAFVLGEKGTLGLSMTLLDVGEMEVTTEAQQEGTGIFFNSTDLALGVSYGYRFYDKFTIGGTVKYINQRIWHESASGFAIDIGTLMITPFKDIRLGMNISNFGTDMRMEGKDLLTTIDPDPSKSGNNQNVFANVQTDRWPLPMTMRVGLSGEVIQNRRDRLTIAADWVHPNDNDEFMDVGAEYAYWEMFAVRAGYKSMRPKLEFSPDIELILSPDDSGGGVTLGAGMNIGLSKTLKLKLDYAFESYDRLGNIHKYSLGLNF